MLEGLNRVIDYIEEHLTEEALPPEVIAECAGVSDYHFRKIFFYLTGMTLNEYIKTEAVRSKSGFAPWRKSNRCCF